MTTVYRVENDFGQGPYTGGWQLRNPDLFWGFSLGVYDRQRRSTHLRVSRSVISDPRGYKYGFESMQSLFRWFGGFLPQLIEDGYRVVKIENANIKAVDPGVQLAFAGTTDEERKPMSYNPEDLTLALGLAADHVKSVSYSSPSVRTVSVLSAAASWVTGALFPHAPAVHHPRAVGSGKSTFLSAIQPLVQNPVRNSGQLSTTFAYRNDFRAAVAEGNLVPVSMVDETKHIFRENGKGGSSHPLYAILTEGYSKAGAPVRYQEKDLNVSYSCYQLAILASRGNQSLPEDVLDRAIIMELSKKPDGMKLASLDDPTVASNGTQLGLFLRTAVQAAEQPLRIIARDTDWYEQAKLDSRTADVWTPLYALAELAGEQWPAQVAAAYAELGAKNSRNLPTRFQLQVDTLAYLNMTGEDAARFPARNLSTTWHS